MVVAGFESSTNSPGKTLAAPPCGAESGAVSSDFKDAGFDRVAQAWPTLPEHIRAAVLELVGTVGR
jgi:hypothetical protein